ncbi:MAG: ABC transporter ATP-binding protein [Anaerolineaceae bacterium]|nr:ABC transporter ATP-binding protein [Anaerolineaceae bacterium]
MKIPLQRYWDLLVKYLQRQRRQFIVLAVLLLGSIGLQLFIPQITRYFIDTATSPDMTTDTLVVAAVAFIGLAIVQQVVSVGAAYVGENVAWIATNQLRQDLTRHCLRLDMAYHNDTSPGELIERIDGDVAQLANFFSQLVLRIFGNLLLLFGILFVLFTEDWRVGIAFTVFAFASLYALNRVRGVAVEYERKRREVIAELFGFLEERLAGTEDIRSSGAVDFVINRLYRLHHSLLDRWQKAAKRFFVVRVVAGIITVVGYAVAFAAGYSLFTAGVITIGTVYLIINYTSLLGRPFRELTSQVENLQNVGASIERLEELLSIQSTINDGPGADIPDGPLSLAFRDLSFAYAENDYVLRDIDFRLKPGEVIGLLGRTGSGKTTITRLIFRLYETTQGCIELGGVDVRQPHLEQLRQRVAMVTQDVQLFQASVRDNVTFFDRSITDEQILSVIEELELSDWFATLPEGLDTRLETGGRSLSAGEAQLLAFTRVFLRDPGLVILDEASSRLDPATEQRIERAVDKLLRNRTAIIVAHRLGTVQRADSIMIMENGRIIEYGEREQLALNPQSRFAGLLQTGLEGVLA